MEPEEKGEESPCPPPTSPDRKNWAIIALVIIVAGIAAAASLPGLLAAPPVEQAHPISGTIPQTTITPPSHWTPGPTLSVSPGATPSANTTANATPTWSGPPGFTVSVSPTQATAGRGETVVYRMTIEGQNGFSGQIHMEVTAGFLFFSQTQDLGYQGPPFPKTIEYPFTVPDTLPSGVSVNGVVKSTGDGITRENQLTLTVR